MSNKEDLINKIDKLLPQTQCGLCDHTACRPYATAIVEENERIDACPPGGVETLIKLADFLKKDPAPFIDDMREKEKTPSIAVIREDECIGCTKCIQACPTDAIIGAAKKMHIVLTDACTGCELCIEPCPVDCIDMKDTPLLSESDKNKKADAWRERYNNRNARLQRIENEKKQRHHNAKLAQSPTETIAARKAAIAAAVLRAKQKKQGQ